MLWGERERERERAEEQYGRRVGKQKMKSWLHGEKGKFGRGIWVILFVFFWNISGWKNMWKCV